MAGKNIAIVLVCLTLWNCAGISTVGTPKYNLYTADFLKRISVIKGIYVEGRRDAALSLLRNLQEEKLADTESALVRNLTGVIHFSKKDYSRAIFYFNSALGLAKRDDALMAQIQLNLASAYYKLGRPKEAYSVLSEIRSELLDEFEGEKFYKLGHTLAKAVGNDRAMIAYLIGALKKAKNLGELQTKPAFESLLSKFFTLSDRERLRIYEKNEKDGLLAVGYLAYLDAEKTYYQKRDRGRASDIFKWLRERYRSNAEIIKLVDNFVSRVESDAKMDFASIGVILPLSGKRSVFGKRALTGIDKAIRSMAMDKYKVHIVDSKGVASVGKYRVRELVENNHVSVIIGGLFSREATEEYLEAKKRGVFFISLSQIHLSKEQKDHLLLEIPGSIESQIKLLFSEQMLRKFGRNAAIIYPNDVRGEAYVNEFWRKAHVKGVRVVGVQSYNQEEADYQDSVKNILGLKFIRERQEEYDILNEIYMQGRRSVRRIQILGPQIDFDWIFIPTFPKEALQIIPSFVYFDAFDLNLIGGPSWRSHSLVKENHKMVNLYFMADDIDRIGERFHRDFGNTYKTQPRVLEMLGHDAFMVVASVLKGVNFHSRNELDRHIRSKGILVALTGSWMFEDGVWIKKLAVHQIRERKIVKI